MIRQDLTFLSDGTTCAAWWYVPEGTGKRPFIVMAHGFGGTRELGLDAYAKRFCEAGLCVLLFDYRHFGASQGEPRELLSIQRQLADYRAALAFARQRPEADPERGALWGVSFSGGHVMMLAAEDLALRAVVALVPFGSGKGLWHTTTPRNIVGLTRLALRDVLASIVGRPPVYAPLIAKTGELALMSGDEHERRYRALIPPGVEAQGRWRNRACARISLSSPSYEPARALARARVPVLLAVGANDTLAPASYTLRAAENCARAEVHCYPGGHFDYFDGDGFERAIGDQLKFLRKHLGVLELSPRVSRPAQA